MLDDGKAHFKIRKLNIDSKSTHKPGYKSVLETVNVGRFAIGGENYLFAGHVKGVEGVKEFFLDIFFTGDELNVVDQDAVEVSIFIFELTDIFGFE